MRMIRLDSIRIKVKLLVGFIVVALIAGGIGGMGLVQMKTMDQRDQELYNQNTIPISLISDASTAYQRMRISVRDIVLYDDQETQQKNEAYVKELDQAITKLFAEFEQRITTKEIRDEFQVLTKTFDNYRPARDKLIQLAMTAGEQKKALFLMKREGASVAKTIDDSITKLKDLEVAQAGVKAKANSTTAETARRMTILMSAIGVLLAIVMGVLLARSINAPLRMAVDLTTSVASGDLSQQLFLERGDEIGELCGSLNHMCAELGEMIGATIEAASELSSSAESQAACIEETSASVCEIDARTGEISRHASNTDSLMRHTIDMINKAKDSLQALVGAIRIIEEASVETTKIVKTIDGIAFQTTLLALNAAVEAARAGEAGAGFAVVAGEVRTLALRTTESAKQTAEHIMKVTSQIKDSGRLAGDLSQSFALAEQDARQSASLASEISTLLKDQVEGSRQITSALQQMAESTQHHASVCDEMVDNLRHFHIREEAGAASDAMVAVTEG